MPLTRRRAGSGLLALGVALAGPALLLAPGTGTASSHREAPLTASNPLVDNTDTYVFRSPDKPDSVTLIANWIPFQDPAGGPNFYPWGDEGYRYNIKVDNNGDAKPDIVYRWTFTTTDNRNDTFLYNNGPVTSFDDPNLLFKQNYTLEKITRDGAVTTLVEGGKATPSYVGETSFPNYAALRDETIAPLQGVEGFSFAGQADDPFFLDLRVFDLLYGADLSLRGNDTVAGYNVNSIALQVPISEVTAGGDGSGIIGVWATTDQQTLKLSSGKATPTGEFVQVSRLGAPLVNELVMSVPLKNTFNAIPPVMDADIMAVVDRVKDPEVPKLIEKIYGIPAPPAPREDIVAAFLTGIEGLNKPPTVRPAEMLRLNTTIPVTDNPKRLGVLAKDTGGFPNGRRLIDDVVDIELQVLEGAIEDGIIEALAAGDKVDQNDKEFGNTFPYLALPHPGSSVGLAGGGSVRAGGSGVSGSSPQGSVAAGFGGGQDGLPVLPLTLGAVAVVLIGAGTVLRFRRG